MSALLTSTLDSLYSSALLSFSSLQLSPDASSDPQVNDAHFILRKILEQASHRRILSHNVLAMGSDRYRMNTKLHKNFFLLHLPPYDMVPEPDWIAG